LTCPYFVHDKLLSLCLKYSFEETYQKRPSIQVPTHSIYGAVLFFLAFFVDNFLLAGVFGAAVAWLGYAVWTGAGETAAVPQPAT
jgi:hypothetical protein